MKSPQRQLDLEQLLNQHQAQVHRVAAALCGDPVRTRQVVENVLNRSITISPKWKTADDARRWFMRYTVLRSREFDPEHLNHDALLESAPTPEFAAMISALRHLPMQQREALLLQHGEQMELHQLAMAMDCSSAAAANHLVSAVTTLKQLDEESLGEFLPTLPGLMRQLAPENDAAQIQIRKLLARQRRRNWTSRMFRIVLWIIILAIVVTATRKLWR